MISSQRHQKIDDFDEMIENGDHDFKQTGLKSDSVIRISRLAVIEESRLKGSIGSISDQRLNRIKSKIANWIKDS